MDQENTININLNSADEDSLTKLQGIGSHLAKQIIDARPFNSIEELTRVRGISDKDVERLRPYLSISDTSTELHELEEMNVKEEMGELDVNDDYIESETSAADSATEDQPLAFEDIDDVEEVGDIVEQKVDEASIADEDVTSEEQVLVSSTEVKHEPLPEELDQEEIPAELPSSGQQPSYITRGGACSLVLIVGFFTLILAVAVTLGIISSINQGRLNYASPSQVAALQSQNETLSAQSQALAEDIDSLRTRMDNLESLSGQVSEMETEINAMQEEIDLLQEQVIANKEAYDELVTQVTDIEEEIQALFNQSERFQSFLDGLRSLMEELFPQSPQAEELP